MGTPFNPDAKTTERLNAAASDVYRDAGQKTGNGYQYEAFENMYPGWAEMKIDRNGRILNTDLTNPASKRVYDQTAPYDFDKKVFEPLRDKGYRLGESNEIYARVYVNTKTHEAIIAFRGTDQFLQLPSLSSGKDISPRSDWDDNIAMFGAGSTTGQYYGTMILGKSFLDTLKEQGFKKEDITVVGHSKDGGLGSIFAARYGLNAYAINPAPASKLMDTVDRDLPPKTYVSTMSKLAFGASPLGQFLAPKSKDWPAPPKPENPIKDGSNIHIEVTEGDVLNRFFASVNAHLPKSFQAKYVGNNVDTAFVHDKNGVNFKPPSDMDATNISYHSATLPILLKVQPELIELSHKVPEFSAALFNEAIGKPHSPEKQEDNRPEICLSLAHDKMRGGKISEMLVLDLQRIIEIKKDWNISDARQKALVDGAVMHARNQVDRSIQATAQGKSFEATPLIQTRIPDGSYYVKTDTLDRDAFGKSVAKDNPLRSGNGGFNGGSEISYRRMSDAERQQVQEMIASIKATPGSATVPFFLRQPDNRGDLYGRIQAPIGKGSTDIASLKPKADPVSRTNQKITAEQATKAVITKELLFGHDHPESRFPLSPAKAQEIEGDPQYIKLASNLVNVNGKAATDPITAKAIEKILQDPNTDPNVLRLAQERFPEQIKQISIESEIRNLQNSPPAKASQGFTSSQPLLAGTM